MDRHAHRGHRDRPAGRRAHRRRGRRRPLRPGRVRGERLHVDLRGRPAGRRPGRGRRARRGGPGRRRLRRHRRRAARRRLPPGPGLLDAGGVRPAPLGGRPGAGDRRQTGLQRGAGRDRPGHGVPGRRPGPERGAGDHVRHVRRARVRPLPQRQVGGVRRRRDRGRGVPYRRCRPHPGQRDGRRSDAGGALPRRRPDLPRRTFCRSGRPAHPQGRVRRARGFRVGRGQDGGRPHLGGRHRARRRRRHARRRGAVRAAQRRPRRHAVGVPRRTENRPGPPPPGPGGQASATSAPATRSPDWIICSPRVASGRAISSCSPAAGWASTGTRCCSRSRNRLGDSAPAESRQGAGIPVVFPAGRSSPAWRSSAPSA